MKGIHRLFGFLGVLFALSLQMVSAAPHLIDGKVTFVIESKPLTAQEAQTYITSKTAIPLKVSLIFEGGWVTQFNAGLATYLNASAFAFGITQSGGASAPLLKTNVPAYIYAASSMGCTAPDGGSLVAPTTPASYRDIYIRAPQWEEHNGTCPTYAYGTLLANNTLFDEKYRDTTIDGKPCIILDLFNIYLRLKDLQTVYVRGIDCNNASDGVPSTDNENDLGGATVGTTILNIIGSDGGACYWPGAKNPTAADWTLAGDSKYFGGIIPGGIFIEQAPEAAQFEPSLSRGQSRACSSSAEA